jgi:hypothetical protein
VKEIDVAVTDEEAQDFMQVGVLSAYRPAPPETPMPEDRKHLTRQRWYDLLRLAHMDKAKAFELYSRYYLSTDGQVYWSDLHQTSEYLDDYVEYLKKVEPQLPAGSLMITELYVPRARITDFIRAVVEVRSRRALPERMVSPSSRGLRRGAKLRALARNTRRCERVEFYLNGLSCSGHRRPSL